MFLAFVLWNTNAVVLNSWPLGLGELGVEGQVSVISPLIACPQTEPGCYPEPPPVHLYEI